MTWTSGLGGATSAADLMRFQEALYGGQIVDPVWIERMRTPRNRLTGGVHYGADMATIRFQDFFPWVFRGMPEPSGGLGILATHMFYYTAQRTHVILNYGSWSRMNVSFQAHAHLARMISRYG